jgi:hypothetical protein
VNYFNLYVNMKFTSYSWVNPMCPQDKSHLFLQWLYLYIVGFDLLTFWGFFNCIHDECWTQDHTLGRQVLNNFRYSANLFALVTFELGSHFICLGHQPEHQSSYLCFPVQQGCQEHTTTPIHWGGVSWTFIWALNYNPPNVCFPSS